MNNENKLKIDDTIKAKVFTHNAKVSLRSLSDAIVCTQQIATINCNKEMYLNKTSLLDKTIKRKALLLAKYCDHEICNANIIASNNLTSYYTYFMFKFSVNLYLNFYENLKKSNDYFALSREFDFILNSLNMELKDYLNHTKRKHFIITRNENGEVDVNL